MIKHTISFQLPSDFFEEPYTPLDTFGGMLKGWFEEDLAVDHDFKLQIDSYKCRICGSYNTEKMPVALGMEFLKEYFCRNCSKYSSPDERG
jgi:hypothetical protein